MSKAVSKVSKTGQAKLIEFGIAIRPGDTVLDDSGRALRVAKINKDGIELQVFWQGDQGWSHYGTIAFERFGREYVKIDRPLEELEAETLDEVKDLDKLDPNKDSEDETEDIESKELVPTMSKATLLSLQAGFEARRKKFKIMERILSRKRSTLQSYVNEMEKRIAKVQKVLDVIELYLGIKEEILKIRDGEPTNIDTPISFRQQVLYMDEEVGDPTDEGLDFRKIDEFDAWVANPENLNKLLPEPRGVVVLKPRRSWKDYGDHWFVNAVYNAENKKSYVLVRNGEILYRIWSDHLNIDKRLFPAKSEFKELLESMSKYSTDEYKQEKTREWRFDYNRSALMLQGLIDRTTVFFPIHSGLNLFKSETYANGQIRFIYDDEVALPPERRYWNDWHSKINSSIRRGSRVYFACPKRWSWKRDSFPDYVPYQFKHVDAPMSGVYKVVEMQEKDGKRELKFIYNPEDTIYPQSLWKDAHSREKGIGFTCSTNSSFILNYDEISLDDVEYYINSRVDRENYLSMIPVLWGIKKLRLKEIEWEKHFVKLVADRMGASEQTVWKAVDWWKYKNIWKRPIKEDDAKALRMIERKVKASVDGTRESSKAM